MTKTFGLITAAALLASVTAFAQNSAPSSDTTAPPAAASDTAKSDDAGAKPMHKHHHHMSGMSSKGTDENADKLNACMSNATPTSQQESCLKSAAGTDNG